MDAFDRAAAMFEAEGEAHDAGHTLIRAAQTALTIDKPGWARDRIRRARALLEQLGDVRALGDRDRAVDVLEAAATVLAPVGRKGDADTARRLVLASSRDDRN